MKKLLIILSLPIFIGCGNHKTQPLDQENGNMLHCNTFITVTKAIPYCGGAQPTDEMLNRFENITGEFTLIYPDGTNKAVNSDSLGIIKLHLSEGKYSLKEKTRRGSLVFYNYL